MIGCVNAFMAEQAATTLFPVISSPLITIWKNACTARWKGHIRI